MDPECKDCSWRLRAKLSPCFKCTQAQREKEFEENILKDSTLAWWGAEEREPMVGRHYALWAREILKLRQRVKDLEQELETLKEGRRHGDG